MRAYLLGRVVAAVPVLFGVSVVIFLMKLIPGDAAQVLAERHPGRGRADPRTSG